jgi:hypothetical protein
MNSKRIRHEIARELKGGEKYEFKVLEKVAVRLNLGKDEVLDCINRMVYLYREIDRSYNSIHLEELALTGKYDPARKEEIKSYMIELGTIRTYINAESENLARIKVSRAISWLANNLDDVEAAVSAGNMEI